MNDHIPVLKSLLQKKLTLQAGEDTMNFKGFMKKIQCPTYHMNYKNIFFQMAVCSIKVSTIS